MIPAVVIAAEEFVRYLRWRLAAEITLTADERVGFERALRLFGTTPVLCDECGALRSPGGRGGPEA